MRVAECVLVECKQLTQRIEGEVPFRVLLLVDDG